MRRLVDWYNYVISLEQIDSFGPVGNSRVIDLSAFTLLGWSCQGIVEESAEEMHRSGMLLVHVLLLGSFLVNVAREKENKMVVLCREMNDESAFDNSVPRVYLYSRVDEMVGCEEVEEHAAIAKRKGWDVTMVRFEKSAHCGHVREDEQKYWGAILEAWKSSEQT